MTDQTPSVPHRRSKRALWFSLHGWFALPIWGFLALICITGTLSVISEEITWLVSPEVRAYKPHENAEVSYTSVANTISAKFAGAKIESIQITQPYMASLVRVSFHNGETKRFYVNQYTGKIQGEVTGIGFRGFILALHGWLLFPWQNDYSIGWYLVTFLSIPLIGSIVSGLIVFKHFYRVIFHPQLRFSTGSRVFWGDLHRLIAVWSIWFAIAISSSGVWFLVKGVLDQNQVKLYPDKVQLKQTQESIAKYISASIDIPLDIAIANAKLLMPDLTITYVEFPEDSHDTLMIQGKKSFSILRDNVNTINFNPHDGLAIASRSASDLSLIQFLSALLTPLHFGDFSGLTSKIIWFIFGCLMSALVCSGFFIWTKRTFQPHKRTLSHNAQNKKNHLSQLHINKRKRIKLIVFWASWLIILTPIYYLLVGV